MIEEATAYLRSRTSLRPSLGIALGSGMGAFAGELSDTCEVPYAGIPGWPRSTTKGHAGTLLFGRLDGLELAVMAGRAHLYEGYTPAEVTNGVRVLGRLGINTMVFTNAAGAINPAFETGGLVLISDHINLQGCSPLAGSHDDACGPRFTDMSEAYSRTLRNVAKQVAEELCVPLSEGVYAAVLGPCYETPAEIRFLRLIGADMVGMSTVPEVIVANHIGMRVLGISCITNMAAGLVAQKIDHQDVLETGRLVREKLVRFLKALLPRLAEGTK